MYGPHQQPLLGHMSFIVTMSLVCLAMALISCGTVAMGLRMFRVRAHSYSLFTPAKQQIDRTTYVRPSTSTGLDGTEVPGNSSCPI
jgi:hypothetical protein